MNKMKFLGLGLLLCSTLCWAAGKSPLAGTTLYKWVDDKGETHYGEVVPPEYADRDSTQLDAKGIKLKNNKPRDAAADSPEASAERQAVIEQRRKDRALLNTYSNEKEIDLALGRNLQQVQARIESVQLQLKSANASLADYNQELANLKKAKKNIPESLLADVSRAQTRVSNLDIDLKEAQDKEAAVRAAYGADKLRFHELTQAPAK